MSNICLCCGQPKPVLCIECGSVTHWKKSKQSASGNRYQIRECENGHTTVVTHDGQVARKYSRALEHEGMPPDAPMGTMSRSNRHGKLHEYRA